MYEIGQKIELDSGKRLICSPEPTILEDESFCKGCVGRDEEHECSTNFCADIRDFTGDICGDFIWTEDLSPPDVEVTVAVVKEVTMSRDVVLTVPVGTSTSDIVKLAKLKHSCHDEGWDFDSIETTSAEISTLSRVALGDSFLDESSQEGTVAEPKEVEGTIYNCYHDPNDDCNGCDLQLRSCTDHLVDFCIINSCILKAQ